MIRTSGSTEQLDEAFAKAQAKFTSAKKSTEGQIGTRKYKYADIAELIEAMLPFLNAEGISVRQHPGFEYKAGEGDIMEPFMTVTTRITYKGQWEESDISLPAIARSKFEGERFDAQSCGSALTYACRYALQGIGVISREDDDGAAASGRGTHEEAQETGQKKIEALKTKLTKKDAVGPANSVPSLFYTHTESGYYEILGDEGYKSANRDLLKPFWQPNAKAILVNDEQLEGLKFHFEERKVPFSLLKEVK